SRFITLKVGAGKKINARDIVVTDDTTGYAEAASTASGKTAWGSAVSYADNTGGSAGAKDVTVEESFEHVEFLLANDTSAPLDQGDVGKVAYSLSAGAVTATATGSIIGLITEVTSAGVWVRFGTPGVPGPEGPEGPPGT